MEQINVEQLVAQLEEMAAAQEAQDSCAPDPDETIQVQAAASPFTAPTMGSSYAGRFNPAAYADETAATTVLWNVPAEGPLPGGLRGFVQRVVRKLIRFYTLPARAEQNRFNERVAAALNELGGLADDMQHTQRQLFESPLRQALYKANGETAQAIAALRADVAALCAENAALRARLDALETRGEGQP